MNFSIANYTEQVAFNNYTIFSTFKQYIYLLIQGKYNIKPSV